MAEGVSKLSEEQIFECLKSLNVPVRTSDLKSPTREFIVRVFECFVRDLQIDIASDKLRSWEATSHIEDGDIFEESQLLLLLAMSVNHITDPLGLNITIRDLIEPKPKRTKKILNYLIIFWKYYLQKYGRFIANEKTFGSERKRAEDLAFENESLDEKYNDKLQTLNSLEPSKNELARIVSSKEKKAAELKNESESLQSDYRGLKTKELSLREEISASNLNYIRAKEKLDELSQLILSSPKQKQINSEIQALDEKIKVTKIAAKEYETKYKEEVKKLYQIDEEEKEQQKFLNILNEITEIDPELRETIRALVDIHQKTNEEEDQVKRLQTDLKRKENWKLQQDQKSTQIALNSRKQIEFLEEELKMNQNEAEKAEEKLECTKAAVKNAQDTIDSKSDLILKLAEKFKDAHAMTEKRKELFTSKMKEISHQFKEDCDDVKEAIKVSFPNVSES